MFISEAKFMLDVIDNPEIYFQIKRESAYIFV